VASSKKVEKHNQNDDKTRGFPFQSLNGFGFAQWAMCDSASLWPKTQGGYLQGI
jgi:hypothetical protein